MGVRIAVAPKLERSIFRKEPNAPHHPSSTEDTWKECTVLDQEDLCGWSTQIHKGAVVNHVVWQPGSKASVSDHVSLEAHKLSAGNGHRAKLPDFSQI